MPRFASLVFPATAATLCALASFTAPSVRADVKVVSHVTITGAPMGRGAAQTPTDQTVTTFYKGAKTRTETGGSKSVVSIYDTQSGALTIVNAAQKTYTVTSLKALGQNPMMAMLDIKTKADMKPGGKTKVIGGKPCKNYLWQATISMGVNQAAMPMPTGKNGAAAQKVPTGPLFTIKMDGEQWTTEAVKLPGGATGKSMMPAMMSGPLSSMPGLTPLMSKLSAIKGLPLSSTVTQTFVRSAAMMGMPGGGGGGNLPQSPMVTRTDVVSISEATLPDALFTPPAGFRKVENKMPGMPGGKMRM